MQRLEMDGQLDFCGMQYEGLRMQTSEDSYLGRVWPDLYWPCDNAVRSSGYVPGGVFNTGQFENYADRWHIKYSLNQSKS